MPPKMHPIKALETINPSKELVYFSSKWKGKTKNLFNDSTVPEITAVS